MLYWKIFLAFFVPGILGYGGGPSSIPLIENEVVDRYGWLSTKGFSEVLALANSLPGPIATKMAGYIGYQEGGILGAIVGVFASVAPSLVLMIALLSLLYKYKDSPRVKKMTTYVRPAIAVMLGVIAYQFLRDSSLDIGLWQTLFLAAASYILMEKIKVHPALVILVALGYGAVFLR